MPCCLGLFCPPLKTTKFLWMAPSNWTGQNLHRSEQATCTSQNWDCLCSLSMLLRDLSLSYGHQWTHYVSNTECQYFGFKKKCKSGSAFILLSKNALSFLSINLSLSFFLDCLLPRIHPGKAPGPGHILMEKGLPKGLLHLLRLPSLPCSTHPPS